MSSNPRAQRPQPSFILSTLTAALLLATNSHAEEATVNSNQEMETITVTAAKEATEPGLAVGHATITKDDTPLLETPQAVSVITAEDMQRRGVTRLADALRPVAGVTRSSTYGYYDAYQIRGFDAAYGSVYLDGLLTANVAGSSNEMAGLERVEVIKGPASMLYGSAPLGGIVNMVSKRPQAESFANIGVATGSYGLLETTVDANSALNSSGTLLGRVNLLYRDSDDFVDFSDKQRIYVAPSVSWQAQDSTKLTLLARYEKNNDSPWSPVSAWGTVKPSAHGELPINFSINNAEAQHDQENKQIGYVFDQELGSNLRFSQTLRYTEREANWNDWIFWAGFIDQNVVGGVQQGHIAGRYVYGPFKEKDKDFAVDNRLSLKLETGIVTQTLLAGIDYRNNHSTYQDAGSNFDPTANPLDVLNPDYGSPFIHDPASAYGGDDKSWQSGYYLQDHIAFDKWATLTLGLRADTAKSGGSEDHQLSPRIGVTVSPVTGYSLYANWSQSFVPQTGSFTFEGTPLPPETGTNIETGLKVSSEDGRLNGMISLYQLTRQDVATDDPAHPNFFLVTGEQRSRGFEVEGQWKPLEPLTLSLAYSRINAEITDDNTIIIGTKLQNVPKDSINLFGEYIVPSGPLANLGLSLGALYNSSKNGSLYGEDLDGDDIIDTDSYFTLPSYILVDAGLSYLLGPWSTRLNVNNVFNTRYYPDSCCLDRVTPGEPRNWRLSVNRSF